MSVPAAKQRNDSGKQRVREAVPGWTTAKLSSALAVLVVVGAIPGEHWPALVSILAITWMGLALAQVSGRTLCRRLWQFVPFAGSLALATAWSQPRAEAGLWLVVTGLRCVTALCVGLWLVHVLSAREFLSWLTWCRLPPALVTTVSFLLRYLVVMWEEHERLRMAQLARAGGPPSGWARWIAAVQRMGLLLLRAVDRAERTQRALLARGWNGTSPWTA